MRGDPDLDEGRALNAPSRGSSKFLPLALLFVTIGVLHFVAPRFFLAIVPPWVPDPALAVSASGVAEIAGGLGLLVPRVRRFAGWGLLLLLVAVFPANVHMLRQALAAEPPASPAWLVALWVRLPLQPLLMVWVWRAAIRGPSKPQ